MEDTIKIPRHRVYAEQVRLLYRGSIRSVAMNYVALMMLVILFLGQVATTDLVIWLLIMITLTTARLYHAIKGAPYSHFFSDPAAKSRVFVFGAGLQGLAWGLSLGYFHPQLTIEYEAITFMLVIIAMAVSMITFSTSKPAYFVFMVAVVTPQVISLLMEGQRLQIILCLFMVAGCIILTVAYLWNYNRLYRAISMRFERSNLVDSLQRANRDLESSNEHLKRLQHQLTNASLTDELTGIANRRNFNTHLEKEWRRSQRKQTEISCLMIDIDHFKQYNDYYGHQQGDNCLKTIAETIRYHMKRPADMVARYGGEEFIVILPDTPLDSARAIADKIAVNIRAIDIRHEKSPHHHVTVSMGVACIVPSHDSESGVLIKEADQALYRAKGEGRNRIVAAG